MKENKIIAEFMGWKPHTLNELIRDNPFGESEIIPIKSINYHTSWDWLMPVVEKIESLGYEVQIRNTDCIIFQLLDTIKYKPIVDISSGNGKKDSTYIAVVEFIKDYNDGK